MILIMSISLCILSLCLLAVAIGFTISNYRDYKKMLKQLKRDKDTKKIVEITEPLYFYDAVSGIVVSAEDANKVVGSITRRQ